MSRVSARTAPACLWLSLLLGLCCGLPLNALSAQCSTPTIQVNSPSYANTKTICVNAAATEVVSFRVSGTASGTSVRYVLTDQHLRVLATSAQPTFEFGSLGAHLRYVLAVSYRGNWLLPDHITTQPAPNLYELRLATGCAQISSNRASIIGVEAEASHITTSFGDTSTVVCLDGQAAAVGFRDSGARGKHYVWIVTDTFDRIRHLRFDGFHDFRYDGSGVSRVYGLAYTESLLLQPGQVLKAKPIASGCADLSDNHLTVVHAKLTGTQIRVNGQERFSINSAAAARFTISSNANGAVHRSYVVIDRQAQIHAIFNQAAVDLSSLPIGSYLLYEYEHTGRFLARVGESLWQRQPNQPVAEECFRNSNNALVIDKQTPALQPACLADAGAMQALRSPVTISNGIARVTAFPEGMALVPSGYKSVFLLTRGQAQTIEAFRADAADFSVTAVDSYRLYRFVGQFEQPQEAHYFNLSSIRVGQMTLAMLRAQLLQNDLCASISRPAHIAVLPEVGACLAFAGTATQPAVLIDSSARTIQLSALPNGGAVVPSGSSLFFALSQNSNLEVIALSTQPAFTVRTGGNYAIHPVVAQVTSAAAAQYVDTSTWRGMSLFDLLDDLVSARVCADIDLGGAPFSVAGFGGTCTAVAASLRALSDTLLLTGGSVRIEAAVQQPAVLPVDFEQTYLLSNPQGVILQFAARARFTIRELGTYRIHNWVGEFTNSSSNDYVSTALLQLGTTTLADLLQLYELSGKCGAIDSVGVTTVVVAPMLSRTSNVDGSELAELLPTSLSIVQTSPVESTPAFAAPSTQIDSGMAPLLSIWSINGQLIWRASAAERQVTVQDYLRSHRLPAGMYIVRRDGMSTPSTQQIIVP